MPRIPLPWPKDRVTGKVMTMKAVVVYESHWGNTAAIAYAIAEGIGPDAQALTTDEATETALDGADLVVAGAPVIAFSLASEKMRDGVAGTKADTPADLSHPLMRAWLEKLPRGVGAAAAFETKIRWSPGSATKDITRGLSAAGYVPLDRGRSFIVKGKAGPLREGELQAARSWGHELAAKVRPI